MVAGLRLDHLHLQEDLKVIVQAILRKVEGLLPAVYSLQLPVLHHPFETFEDRQAPQKIPS